MKEKTTVMHLDISLNTLLKMTLKGEPIFLETDEGRPLTELEVYQLITDEKAQGHKYFCGCDNRDELGRCKGHEALT